MTSLAANSQPQPKRQRSRSRIGADEARLWVRNLRLGNPYAKAILMAIANYMNEDGSAWPGIATLALDTDIAEDTVVSRLRWSESIGAIAMFKCWVDEHGRRNSDGRGRVTSNEIRFLFDADKETIEANAAGAIKPRPLRGAALASHEAKEISPRPCGEQNEDQDTDISYRHGRELNEVSSRLAPEQPPTRAARIEELEESKKDSPPYPPPVGFEVESNDEGSEQAGEASEIEGWEAFKSAFESDGAPIIRPSIAKTLFAALGPHERKRVTRAAHGLIAFRTKGNSKDRKPGAKPSAQTFIREIDAWAAWEKLAPPETVAMTTCLRGSEEFRAGAVYLMLAFRRVITADTITLRTSMLQAPNVMALARFADANGNVDRIGWMQLDPGDEGDRHRAAAWRERIEQWSGYWIDLESVPVCDSDGTPKAIIKEWNGQELRFPIKRDVLIVPCPWPPLKDGTIVESTGPPIPPLTESDADEFMKTG